MQGIYTLPTNLTSEENTILTKLRKLLRGDAAAGKHEADADHLFEAAKYGGRYFIAHDKRMLNLKNKIAEITAPELEIITLRKFMETCKQHDLF